MGVYDQVVNQSDQYQDQLKAARALEQALCDAGYNVKLWNKHQIIRVYVGDDYISMSANSFNTSRVKHPDQNFWKIVRDVQSKHLVPYKYAPVYFG
jgi:hypothetical protein